LAENSNTYQFIENLARQKGVSAAKIKEIVIESFRKSYCRGENAQADLHFEFDGKLSVYRRYQIVEQVAHPEKEITKDNILIKKGKVKGEVFFLPLDIKNLSLLINYEIKKQFQSNLGTVNWERQHKLFKPRQGELVFGKIKGVLEDYYLVDVEGGTAHWDKREWMLPEGPRPGQRFYFLIKEVKEKEEKNSPQIILTRLDNLFLRKLLEQEIPEIKRDIVAIRDILRLPGLVSKVVVEKGKEAIRKGLEIDPAGTCIGEAGERARSVSRLIYSERIYFVDWTEDKIKLLDKLLSPIKLIRINQQGDNWEIVVSQQKFSLLLQHEGKVLKLIGDYLGKTIHARKKVEGEILENKGKVVKEIGTHKNVQVLVLKEIEKERFNVFSKYEKKWE
jgi:transcription termination/antitermination protein NusA